MTSRFARKLGPLTSMGAVAVLLTACGGGAAKVAATGSQPAGQASSAAQGAPPDAASAKPVKATGGGAFCKAIAASMNAQSLHPGLASGDDAKAQVEAARAEQHEALSIAPSALKPDLQVLVAASDSMFNALVKVNYDYSKLTADDMVDFSAPKVVTAEQHLTTYLKDTCGIDIGAGAAAAANEATNAPPAAGASGSGDDTGAGCKLATIAEISAAAGKPMKLVDGVGGICAYSAVDDASFALEVTIYDDRNSMTTITSVEGGSEHLDGLGDDAFWNPTIGTVFVRKGDRGFSISMPSLANLTNDPAAQKDKMVGLGTKIAGRF
jgi:hypothetical protein